MSLLVDTSVWSLALRKKGPADHPAVRRLHEVLHDDNREIYLTGIILQEVLQAFRADTTFQDMRRQMDAFPLLFLDRGQYVEAARLHRLCASKGITASTTDCLIAVAAIVHECRLLTTDKDFSLLAQHSTLLLETP